MHSKKKRKERTWKDRRSFCRSRGTGVREPSEAIYRGLHFHFGWYQIGRANTFSGNCQTVPYADAHKHTVVELFRVIRGCSVLLRVARLVEGW